MNLVLVYHVLPIFLVTPLFLFFGRPGQEARPSPRLEIGAAKLFAVIPRLGLDGGSRGGSEAEASMTIGVVSSSQFRPSHSTFNAELMSVALLRRKAS
jgi:hypothetical protein